MRTKVDFYCKKCKRVTHPIDVWYLHDNTEFTNRIAIFGKCAKCKNYVFEVIEERKYDNKRFYQLETGIKAEKLIEKYIDQINYTREDVKGRKTKPIYWSYGRAIKDLKNKRYKILRTDFFGQSEVIGHLDFKKTKIEDIIKSGKV